MGSRGDGALCRANQTALIRLPVTLEYKPVALKAALHHTSGYERAPMQRKISARGWLRTRSLGSSTARFDIEINDGGAIGVVRSEMSVIVEAIAEGRATLVTESGRWIAIRPTERTPDGLAFTVLEDLATLAKYFP